MNLKMAFIIKFILPLTFFAGIFLAKSFAQNEENDSRKAAFMFHETGKNKLNELYIYDDFSYVYYKIYDSKEHSGALSPAEATQFSELMDKYDEINWETTNSNRYSKTSSSWGLWGFGREKKINIEDKQKIQSIVDSLTRNANENIYTNLQGDTEEESRDAVLTLRETGASQFNKLYISKTNSYTYYELFFNREYKGYLSDDEEKQLSEIIDKYGEVNWSTFPAGETDGLSRWGFGSNKEMESEDKEKIRSIADSLIEKILRDE